MATYSESSGEVWRDGFVADCVFEFGFGFLAAAKTTAAAVVALVCVSRLAAGTSDSLLAVADVDIVVPFANLP